jgi:hypothetical protein
LPFLTEHGSGYLRIIFFSHDIVTGELFAGNWKFAYFPVISNVLSKSPTIYLLELHGTVLTI